MKIVDLYLDTETTGLSADKQDVIQIGAINAEDKSFEGKCQPFRWDTIAQQALDVHGYQIADLKKFQDPQDLLLKFVEYLREITPIEEDFRIRMIAHNMAFDYRFMKAWWEKCGLETWDQVFLPKEECICTQKMSREAKKAGLIDVPNVKLVTIAAYFKIRFDAHDALGDTFACKRIREEILKLNGEVDAVGEQTADQIHEDGRKTMDEIEAEAPKTTGKMVL